MILKLFFSLFLLPILSHVSFAAAPLLPDENGHLLITHAHIPVPGPLVIANIGDLISIEFAPECYQESTLSEIHITNNAMLTALTIPPFPWLQVLYITNNAMLTALAIPPLERIIALDFHENNSLTTLAIPPLPSLQFLYLFNMPLLTAIKIPHGENHDVWDVWRGDFAPTSGNSFSLLSFRQMVSLRNPGVFTIGSSWRQLILTIENQWELEPEPFSLNFVD